MLAVNSGLPTRGNRGMAPLCEGGGTREDRIYFSGKLKRKDLRVMNTADDRQQRVKPSGRNGNRLPLRRPGERIGGRQKGTPNKSPRKVKEAVLEALTQTGRLKRVGKKWVATGEGGLLGFLEWAAVNEPDAFLRLAGCILVLQEKERERASRMEAFTRVTR